MNDTSTAPPEVSVVICTNTCDQYFDLALTSIETQSLSNIEILIVANGISDAIYTQLSLRAVDPRVRIFRTEVAGVTFSRNLALHLSKSSLMAVMDADDFSYPTRLEKQLEFMRANPDVVICGSSYDVVDEHGAIIHTVSLTENDASIRRQFPWRNPICHPSTLLRRDAILAAGGYHGNSAEDYDLWIRLSMNSKNKFTNILEPLIAYRQPVVSKFRRSKAAYDFWASIQMRTFFQTKRPRWLLACLMTLAKSVIRANKN